MGAKRKPRMPNTEPESLAAAAARLGVDVTDATELIITHEEPEQGQDEQIIRDILTEPGMHPDNRVYPQEPWPISSASRGKLATLLRGLDIDPGRRIFFEISMLDIAASLVGLSNRDTPASLIEEFMRTYDHREFMEYFQISEMLDNYLTTEHCPECYTRLSAEEMNAGVGVCTECDAAERIASYVPPTTSTPVEG